MAKKSKEKTGTGSDGGLSGLESGFVWASSDLTFSFAEESKNGKIEAYTGNEMAAIAKILSEVDAMTGLEFEIFATTEQLSLPVTYEGFEGSLEGYLSYLAFTDGDPNTDEIDVTPVTSDDLDTADIRFSLKEMNSAYGVANYPGQGPGGDVVFDSFTLGDGDLGGDRNEITSFEWELFYHEIGHALGLRHSFEKLFDKDGNLNDGYFTDETPYDGEHDDPLEPLDFGDSMDVTSFTVMSYTPEYDGDNPIYATSWGPQDIFALQIMYGFDMA